MLQRPARSHQLAAQRLTTTVSDVGRRSLVIAPPHNLGFPEGFRRNFAIPAPRSLTRLRFLQVALTRLSDAHNLSPGYRGHSGPHRLPRLPTLLGRSGLFWTVTGSIPSPGSGTWAEAGW